MWNQSSRHHALLAAAFGLAGLAAAKPAVAAPQFTVLYKFHGADGHEPEAGVLIGPGGVLYGTTVLGGPVMCALTEAGCGTLFQLTPPAAQGDPWTESVIYSFTGGTDGAFPIADLAQDPATGTLYGTASGGGANSEGTAYALSPPTVQGGNWSFSLLYGFGATSSDGEQPQAGLIAGPAGSYYGTTLVGGTADRGIQVGAGTVFQLTPPAVQGGAWTHTVLWAFPHGNNDGADPSPGVLFGGPGGSLLGATTSGESPNATDGLIFQLLPPSMQGGAWTEIKAFPFSGRAVPKKGGQPNAGLIADASGAYYGTTQQGGKYGSGVVFQLVPPSGGGDTWVYKVLYNFKGGTDGQVPLIGLTMGAGGVLYGTTSEGGNETACPGDGCGTVFQLAPPAAGSTKWKETVLHRFALTDGFEPYAHLAIDANGVLYGTAYGSSTGYGVVFSVTP